MARLRLHTGDSAAGGCGDIEIGRAALDGDGDARVADVDGEHAGCDACRRADVQVNLLQLLLPLIDHASTVTGKLPLRVRLHSADRHHSSLTPPLMTTRRRASCAAVPPVTGERRSVELVTGHGFVCVDFGCIESLPAGALGDLVSLSLSRPAATSTTNTASDLTCSLLLHCRSGCRLSVCVVLSLLSCRDAALLCHRLRLR